MLSWYMKAFPPSRSNTSLSTLLKSLTGKSFGSGEAVERFIVSSHTPFSISNSISSLTITASLSKFMSSLRGIAKVPLPTFL